MPDPTLRQTAQGAVSGRTDRHNTYAWLGIPYAQPPVGALRWKAPRPPLPWDGVRAAVEYGPPAMQLAGATLNLPPEQWGQPTGSEDCLTLNVYAPQEPQAAPLPVMFWIHGGANTAGASATYPMLRNLAGQMAGDMAGDMAGQTAEHARVIVVSANYRLGILGWFSLAELAQDGDSPEDRSGNFGTLDLIAALRWVQDNIAAFGGDPANVTIFGESAGGLNVYTLLASPLAKGLFHRAIAQSPITATHTVAQARHYRDDPEPGHALSSRELLCAWLQREGKAASRAEARTLIAGMTPRQIAGYVRGLQPAALLAPVEPGALSFYQAPCVLRDGHVLPDAPLEEVFADRGRYNAVPVIIGSNRDEYKLFMSTNPEYVRMLFGRIPMMRDRARYRRDAAYMSALWQAGAVQAPADAMIASGHADVWVYRFDWDEQPAVPLVAPRLLLGAAHVLEVGFALRDLEGEFDPFRSYTPGNLAGRREVSDAMAGYWTRFAHTGEPDSRQDGLPPAALPAWQRWSADPRRPRMMVFDTSADGGIRMAMHDRTVASLRQELAADPAFRRDARARCALYVRMFGSSVFGAPDDPQALAAFAQAHGYTGALDALRPAHWP